MEIRENFQNFLNEFSGNLQRESDRKLSENKALTEYVQSPEGQRASTAVGLGVASLLPIPGAKTRFANQMANIMNPIMSSGARVGRDVMGRVPMPVSKAPVPTNRGPRGPINIEQPAVTPKAPLPGTRNTGGVSETDQAMIKMQQAQMKPPQPPKEGIASMPQGRELERMNKRRNFLITKTRYDQSLIKANEAPSKDYARNLEELQRLEELFKGK